MDMLNWLALWFQSNCNGDWEHSYQNVVIKTLDNPGWSVEIDLRETTLEHKPFEKLQTDNGQNDWLICCKTQGKFRGVGDAAKLADIIRIFQNWSEH